MPTSYRNVHCSCAGSFMAPWIYLLLVGCIYMLSLYSIYRLSLYVYRIPNLSLYICCINIHMHVQSHYVYVLLYTYMCLTFVCVFCVVNYVCVAFVCVLYMYSFKYVVRIVTCSHYVPSNFKSTGRQHLLYVTHVILHIQKRAWPKAGTHFFILNFFIDSL